MQGPVEGVLCCIYLFTLECTLEILYPSRNSLVWKLHLTSFGFIWKKSKVSRVVLICQHIGPIWLTVDSCCPSLLGENDFVQNWRFWFLQMVRWWRRYSIAEMCECPGTPRLVFCLQNSQQDVWSTFLPLLHTLCWQTIQQIPVVEIFQLFCNYLILIQSTAVWSTFLHTLLTNNLLLK